MRTPLTIDNDTGEILPEQPSLFENGLHIPTPEQSRAGTASTGFGQTRKLLDIEPIRLAPWLTPELAEREIALGGFR